MRQKAFLGKLFKKLKAKMEQQNYSSVFPCMGLDTMKECNMMKGVRLCMVKIKRKE